MSKKIATEPFSLTFKVGLDGTVEYVIVRPNLCTASGKKKNMESLFDYVKQVYAEHSEFYGVPTLIDRETNREVTDETKT